MLFPSPRQPAVGTYSRLVELNRILGLFGAPNTAMTWRDAPRPP